MTAETGHAFAVGATLHRGLIGVRRVDATWMLTAYIVILFAVPSGVTIGPLASYGRPSFLFGLVLLAWWVLSRLQSATSGIRTVPQPVRLAFGALLVIVLVSFAVAILRGQPGDQISPAQSALFRMLSWGGVLLVTLDGVRTVHDVTRIVRRLSIGAGVLAALGLLQFFTNQSWLDWVTSIPGLAYSSDGVAQRGAFTRASGTAEHPLEFAVALTGTLPLAFATAVTQGFSNGRSKHPWLWWLPAMVIMVTSLVAVSRSAIIGLVIAVLASLPALPRQVRVFICTIGAVAIVAIGLLIPGMLTTTIALFTGASDDPSAESRSTALSRLPDFVTPSPLVGTGFGTFLPRYYIFDNQWALTLVELGVLGVLALAGLMIGAIAGALRGAAVSRHEDTTLLARTLSASVLAIGVLFAFFDALSFPMSAGLLFIIVGLCGSVRTIGAVDAAVFPTAPQRFPARYDR